MTTQQPFAADPDSAELPELPDGTALERAIAGALAGDLPAAEFADAVRTATLLLAVVEHEDAGEAEDAVGPVVVEIDGAPYGVAFSAVERRDRFDDGAAFILLPGAELRRAWPNGLGLVINPGDDVSIVLGPEQLAGLLDGAGHETVPAGTSVRVGAPEPGLPDSALGVLRTEAGADPRVQAVYQLAMAVGAGPIELVIGVHASRAGDTPAAELAEAVVAADPGFRGVPFVDLGGSLLASAQAATPSIS